jgi:hypothetical protein
MHKHIKTCKNIITTFLLKFHSKWVHQSCSGVSGDWFCDEHRDCWFCYMYWYFNCIIFKWMTTLTTSVFDDVDCGNGEKWPSCVVYLYRWWILSLKSPKVICPTLCILIKIWYNTIQYNILFQLGSLKGQ